MPKFAVDGRTVLAVVGCVAALAACGSAGSRQPGPMAAQQAAGVQIPGDGGNTDAAAAGQVVDRFIDAFVDADGGSACDLMTDAGIAGVVDDGERHTVDEAYQLCVETVRSWSTTLDGAEAAQLRDAEVTDATVDGDTAHVVTSLSGAPIELVRAEDGWLLSNAPTD